MTEQSIPEKTGVSLEPDPPPLREGLTKPWGRKVQEPRPQLKDKELQLLRNKQIDHMISLGYHLRIDPPMSEAEYKASLIVEIPRRPKNLLPDTFVVVDPRITLNALVPVLGIDQAKYRASLPKVDLEAPHTDHTDAEAPYIIWINTGIYKGHPVDTAKFNDVSTEGTQEALRAKGLRGLTVHELLSVVREQPTDYASYKPVYALGTSYEDTHLRLQRLTVGDSPSTELRKKGTYLEAPNQAPCTGR